MQRITTISGRAIPMRGNDLPPADTGWTTIISSDLARALFGASDPIGKRFKQVSPTPSRPRDLVVTGVYDSRHLPSGMTTAIVYRSVKEWQARRYLIRTAGPAVNLASRVESLTREMQATILVSRDISAQLGPSFTLGRTASMPVKGKSQPVEVVEVLSLCQPVDSSAPP